jgi:ubiquinone/menaquinone biosynthesis C-methylase UbiE
MIEFFWKVQTSSLIVEQFYPIEYWQDLIQWARSKIKTKINKICDIGCGNGNMIKVLSENFPIAEIVGVDLTEDSLKLAKDRFKSKYKITFKVGNIIALPFPDDSIDLITVTEVLEHLFLEDLFKGFNEISKKLRNGGYFIASIPFNEKLSFVSCPECGCVFHPYQHMIFEITYDDIKNVCHKNGLEVIGFYKAFNRDIPKDNIKSLLKRIALKILPSSLLVKLFPKPGATGFLARKI